MKYLICGHMRSGTKYCSRLALNLGVGILHEKEGKQGMSFWEHVVCPKNWAVLIHIVRNPIDVISSSYTCMPRSWKYMSEHIGIDLMSFPMPIRAMITWVWWNRVIRNNYPSLTCRVEDLTSHTKSFDDFCKWLNVSPDSDWNKFPPSDWNTCKHRNRPTSKGTMPYRTVTKGDLMKADIQQYEKVAIEAEKYGYVL